MSVCNSVLILLSLLGGLFVSWSTPLGLSDERNIKIIVKDKGIGLAKSNKKKVFSRSNTVNFLNPDSNNISMPLVRSLIELHGGTLNISSDVNDGTSVICALPVSEKVILSSESLAENTMMEAETSVELQDVVNS